MSRNTANIAYNTASVPRPTIASELKLLKEMSRGSPTEMISSNGQFMQGNTLASFMWNKGAELNGGDMPGLNDR